MTKEEFASRLRSQGYKVIREEGTVKVLTASKDDLKDVRVIAKECGYDMSYGWKEDKCSMER